MSEEIKTPEERREAAAIRRRWITLGEILAVAAVLISGLTFWNSYSERTATEAERANAEAKQAAEERKEAALSQRIVLRAEARNEGRSLALSALDPGQAIQNLGIAFPSALEAGGVEAVIEPRIEARWIEDAARAARRAEGKSGNEAGDRRLPVAITTRFVSGGETFSDTTLYDIGYKVDSSLLGGTEVELRGLSHIERARASDARARLDAIWTSRRK